MEGWGTGLAAGRLTGPAATTQDGTTGPATAWQVTEELTWSRGWPAIVGFMRRAALAEAGAHLRHLADIGQVAVTVAAVPEPDLYALVT